MFFVVDSVSVAFGCRFSQNFLPKTLPARHHVGGDGATAECLAEEQQLCAAHESSADVTWLRKRDVFWVKTKDLRTVSYN